MGLFRRLSSGLFSPKEIASFVNDKKIMTVAFFLVLLLISIIPHSLNVIPINKISLAEQLEIRSYFSKADEIPYQIRNNNLIFNGQKEEPKVYSLNGNLAVIFSTKSKINVGQQMAIVFTNDGVALQLQAYIDSVQVPLFKYSDYDKLENIDFRQAKANNEKFWNDIFVIANQEYQQLLPILKPSLIIAALVSNAASMVLFSLLIAYFQRRILISIIPFSKIWQLSVYCLVPYVITNVLAVLFGILFLPLIGLIMMIVYGARMSQALIKE